MFRPESDRTGAPLCGGSGGRRKYPSAAAISPVRGGEADAGRWKIRNPFRLSHL